MPPANFRELRLIARQMQKLTGILASEKNRLHKVLTDGGIRLSVVVSDLHGQSAWAMVKALVAGETPAQVLRYASARLRASEQELLDALEGDLSEAHRFVLAQLVDHVDDLERRIGCFRERFWPVWHRSKGSWARCRPCRGSMNWVRPCCWWRSATTCRPSASRRNWPLGRASALAITNRRANARAANNAKATVMCAASV